MRRIIGMRPGLKSHYPRLPFMESRPAWEIAEDLSGFYLRRGPTGQASGRGKLCSEGFQAFGSKGWNGLWPRKKGNQCFGGIGIFAVALAAAVKRIS